MAEYPYHSEPTHDRGSLVTAARTTAVSKAEGKLKLDVVDKIHLLEPAKHPLTTLLTQVGKVYDGKAWTGTGMRKASCGNPEFGWLEDYYGGRYAKVNAVYGVGDPVTITVSGAGASSAHIFTIGDMIMNARTGERMSVATVAVGGVTEITANRSIGTTAAAAGLIGDGLYIIGNINEENATARNVNTTRSAKQTNFTQIFRRTIALSRTEMKSDVYGEKDLSYLRAKLGTEHLLDIERAFIWGEKNDGTGTNGLPERNTGGVLEFIEGSQAYIQNVGGILTAPDFNTFLREGFTYGDTEKLFMCGGVVLQAINEFARGQIQMKPLAKSYGMQIQEYTTSFGKINLVHNPLFVEDYSGYGFLLDMNCFRYRYMNESDTHLNTNIQIPGTDGIVDEYLTECGLERKEPGRCALLKGVTA